MSKSNDLKIKQVFAYVVAFDLFKKGDSAYDKIETALKKLRGKHILHSTWIVYGTSIEQINAVLVKAITKTDSYVIAEINGTNAIGRVRKDF